MLPKVKLWLCSFITFSLTVSEFVLHHYTHSISLAVLADHSLYNLLIFVTALLSSYLNGENGSIKIYNHHSTFGWTSFTLVASLSSLMFLGALCFGTLVETIQEFSHLDHLMHHRMGVLTIAFVHLLSWIIITSLVGGYTHFQKICTKPDFKSAETPIELRGINLRETWCDLSSCLCTALACIIVKYFSEDDIYVKYVDPIIALVSLIILVSTHAEHAKKLSGILLLKIPEGICAKSLTEDIQFRFSEDVVDINDLHIWDAMHGQIVATLAITYKDDVAYYQANGAIMDHLKTQGITNVTIEPKIEKILKPV